VTNAGSNTVSVINTATKSVIAPSLNVGNRPFGVAVNPAGTRVYVTNAELDLQLNDYRVSVIDTATNAVSTIQVGTATPPVGVYPAGVAVAPDGGHVYVTNHGSDDVTVIETATNTVISRIPGRHRPVGCGGGTRRGPRLRDQHQLGTDQRQHRVGDRDHQPHG
jgi:YVTN family beta-propeller protein